MPRAVDKDDFENLVGWFGRSFRGLVDGGFWHADYPSVRNLRS